MPKPPTIERIHGGPVGDCDLRVRDWTRCSLRLGPALLVRRPAETGFFDLARDRGAEASGRRDSPARRVAPGVRRPAPAGARRIRLTARSSLARRFLLSALGSAPRTYTSVNDRAAGDTAMFRAQAKPPFAKSEPGHDETDGGRQGGECHGIFRKRDHASSAAFLSGSCLCTRLLANRSHVRAPSSEPGESLLTDRQSTSPLR
jgi:hypothetical protein